MKAGLAGMMKQAQQMQENMKRAQEELAVTEVEGQAGSGAVKISMTCSHVVKRVTLAPEALADVATDKEMLEDLLVAAFNDAGKKVEATVQQKMGGMTAGLSLPPGFKLPF